MSPCCATVKWQFLIILFHCSTPSYLPVLWKNSFSESLCKDPNCPDMLFLFSSPGFE
jgi:hypothetical protein